MTFNSRFEFTHFYCGSLYVVYNIQTSVGTLKCSSHKYVLFISITLLFWKQLKSILCGFAESKSSSWSNLLEPSLILSENTKFYHLHKECTLECSFRIHRSFPYFRSSKRQGIDKRRVGSTSEDEVNSPLIKIFSNTFNWVSHSQASPRRQSYSMFYIVWIIL